MYAATPEGRPCSLPRFLLAARRFLRAFLLQRLGVKNGLGLTGDKINKSITLPAFITDVAKVQIYCAWAEAVLGETSFEAPSRRTRSRRNPPAGGRAREDCPSEAQPKLFAAYPR